MNESLINPFNLSHPTTVQTSLFAGAQIARFDTTGRFIAAGRAIGSAEIWDLETRAPIRWLDGHVKGVTSIDWSRNSRYILTSSKDWNVVVWDLASACDPPQRHCTIRFDAPVISASFHPRNSQIVLALLSTGEAYLCDLRKTERSRIELVEVMEESDDEQGQSSRTRSFMTVARFEPSGKYIFIGTTAGSLLVFNSRTKAMIARHKISDGYSSLGPSAHLIALRFFHQSLPLSNLSCLPLSPSRNNQFHSYLLVYSRLVTNSSDRTLRQFILPSYAGCEESGLLDQELEPTHRFNDPINKTAWHAMSYSPDGEWLAGGAADPAAHKVYVWDISNDGQFASALDGGREPLLHLHWHPKKSCIASTTNQGSILIWHCPNPERWGAFAGGFEEVDENVEYDEREDEFDIEDEEILFERKMKAEEEEVDIDTLATSSDPNASALVNGNIIDGTGGSSNGTPASSTIAVVGILGDKDPDILWADEEPDGDDPGEWRMRIVMDNEAADYY